jgi:hypothetical protein
MLTAVGRSGQDYMGFTWYEIFKNGKSTGNSFNALNTDHAIRMYKQFYREDGESKNQVVGL